MAGPAFHRAVVTGGAGFLGSHLCEALLARGTQVLCLDNLVTGVAGNVAHLVGRPGFTMVHADVSEPLPVTGEADLVLHFASPASPVDYLHLPIETLKAGSLGTLHALDLAAATGARFVLASTSEIYGDPQVHPQPESYRGHVNPVGPRSSYDEAKRFGEALTTAYRSQGVDTAVARIFNTYGPRMRAADGRAVPTFVRHALAGEPIPVAGDGTQTRSVCFVDDLVEGVLRLASSGHPGPVNLGNPQELTVLRLAELVREACCSSSPITFVGRPADDPQQRCPDITLARTVLGWEPAVAVEEGLARTVAWVREQRDRSPGAVAGSAAPA